MCVKQTGCLSTAFEFISITEEEEEIFVPKTYLIIWNILPSTLRPQNLELWP